MAGLAGGGVKSLGNLRGGERHIGESEAKERGREGELRGVARLMSQPL